MAASDLKTRAITATCMIAGVAALLWSATVVVVVRRSLPWIGAAILAISAYEVWRATRSRLGRFGDWFICGVLTVALLTALNPGYLYHSPDSGVGMVVIAQRIVMLAAAAPLFWRHTTRDDLVVALGINFLLFLLLVVGGSSLVIVSTHPGMLTALITMVAAGDSGAYLIGRRFGGRPLAPFSSPNKTIVGGLAHLFLVVSVGISFVLWWPPALPAPTLMVGKAAASGGWVMVSSWVTLVLQLALISVAAQLADLAKSLVKRLVDIKDFGSYLPGHGGALDRIDGLLGGSLIVQLFW